MKNVLKNIALCQSLLVLSIALLGGPNAIHAQEFGVMSTKDKADMKKIAVEKIRDLHFGFSKIASSTSTEIKESLIKTLLTEFAENASIEVASRKKVSTYPIAYYLRMVLDSKYRKRYALVDIDFVSFKINDELRPHETELNTYYLDYEFVQRFSASKTARPNKEGMLSYDYVDETRKKGSFKIKKENNHEGTIWRMYYEDITVKSLKIL
ncbi:MAG: hypothetical protein AAFO99_14535 [Bacteroidota bacterium]